MPVAKSKYPCPNCGEYQLYFPDVKGEWGWKDTSKMACWSCRREFSTEFVKKAAQQSAPET